MAPAVLLTTPTLLQQMAYTAAAALQTAISVPTATAVATTVLLTP